MSDLVFTASEFAARAHYGQCRKDGVTPYIVHPARVAMTVAVCMYYYPMLEGRTRDEVIAAAWLHDVIEDTLTSFEDLGKEFPDNVIGMVHLLTNDKDLDGSRPERKKRERERLAPAPEAVRLIKLADRFDNVKDLDGLSEKFQKMYALETRHLVLALTNKSICNSGLQVANGINDIIDPLIPRPEES
jgi:(p)ppGpp synthase/HD superfamily hydrolase